MNGVALQEYKAYVNLPHEISGNNVTKMAQTLSISTYTLF